MLVPSSGLTPSFPITSITSGVAGCDIDHTAYATAFTQMDNPAYFTEKYYESGQQFAVRSCAVCNIKFGRETVLPVYACKEAAKSHIACMHALCGKCHGDRSASTKKEVRVRRATAKASSG
jgi:hypothetical protein